VHTVKSTVNNGPDDATGGQREFKVYDLNYYADEIDQFEWWYEGELMLGSIKVVREFVPCDDRLSKTKFCDAQFFYMTKIIDTKFADKDIVGTMCMIHGFSENSSVSHFEGALMHAMNGFEVVMIDYKGFGFSSGPRGGGFKVQDSHE